MNHAELVAHLIGWAGILYAAGAWLWAEMLIYGYNKDPSLRRTWFGALSTTALWPLALGYAVYLERKESKTL